MKNILSWLSSILVIALCIRLQYTDDISLYSNREPHTKFNSLGMLTQKGMKRHSDEVTNNDLNCRRDFKETLREKNIGKYGFGNVLCSRDISISSIAKRKPHSSLQLLL